MIHDRDAARLRVARAGLAPVAVEHIARTSFGRMPITLVDRARAQLRRFFSEGPWTVEDDAGLSGLVGPGEGWTEEELAPGIRLAFGWRSAHFKVDVEVDAEVDAEAVGDSGSDSGTSTGAPGSRTAEPALPVHERTLGDTFEESVLVESGRDPAELRFTTGPAAAARRGTFTREEQGSSAGVAALFREFDDVETVRIEPGSVLVTFTDAGQWKSMLLRVFDAVTAAFVPPRPTIPDRAYERALAEIGALDVAHPRDLARLVDATTSPDVSFRVIAAARLELADPLLVVRPWSHSLEDSSRAVRRAAIRAAAHTQRPELRLLFERALGDKDACVRYYALRGLAAVGIGRAERSVHHQRTHDDLRVRFAAEAALAGRTPL